MIRSFRHKGLKRLYDKADGSKIHADHLPKISRILALLDVATGPQDMDLPGFSLHRLKGDLKGHYAVSVSGNWRITFKFEDGEPQDVNIVDYH